MQQIVDKKNILEIFLNKNTFLVELGPGNFRNNKDALTIDKYDSDAVDIITDLELGLTFLPDNSVDYIYSSHLMEHIVNLEGLLKEIFRVLKKNGKFEMVVPHFSNPYFYSDYTHKNFFGLYTMSYFSKSHYFKRQVPQFYNNFSFTIEKIKIEFTSPFILRYPFKKMWQFIFNLSKSMQEFYEEAVSFKIPAYQIRFIVVK
jgi:predicted SAM-dependent methyltransferase